MHKRIVSLAADCCCVRMAFKEAECLRIFEGGEFSSSSIPTDALATASSSTGPPNKTGILVMATWKSRWLLLVMPHGRASLYEVNRSRLSLNSTFECPVNTSAVIILDDIVEDCALVVFGTDEGGSSRVHVARLTFSAESLSVKPLRSWRSPGVSSLALHEKSFVLVGYCNHEGVGLFNPFSFLDVTSPTLAARQRIQAIKATNSPEKFEWQKDEFISTHIHGESVPVWVSTIGSRILTLTRCGTLRCYQEDPAHAEHTIFLGFDALGLRSIPATDGVVVCGWRGEVALVDLECGQVARFGRSSETARVEDFAISVSSDSRLLLLQLDADDGGALRVFDLGRSALLGISKRTDDRIRTDDDNVDELVFIGTDGDLNVTTDSPQAKAMMKEAWELMLEETD